MTLQVNKAHFMDAPNQPMVAEAAGKANLERI